MNDSNNPNNPNNSFRPVNTNLAPEMYARGEETTPTTPRPSTAPNTQPQHINRMDDATTPTRASFGASALSNQRRLPAEPFPATVTMPGDTESLRRGNSLHSLQSQRSRESDDMDMDDDGEHGENGDEESEEETVGPDGTRTKKKKTQRFWCTDYPPCQLSFTRSEHLARHIRKHTGERPFQCHCSRRFSRLDNLRQHAQTVHVNEEIPQDSLAATGTRFQRQVRTDRVRPPGNRSRASTAGSQTPGRGHHRNSLSTSSISSVGSYTQREDGRRRPAPLVMAATSNRLSGEYRDDGQYQFRPNSPGFSTPTSATFSTGQNSPRWGSAMQSPITAHSRTQSIYDGHRTPGRRLSVPSAGNPFQSPNNNSYPPPPLGDMNSTGPYSPYGSSMLTSPTTSTSGSTFSRRESITNSDEAWRRRTWHPESYSGFTSRLQNVTTNYYSNGPPPQVPVVPSNAPPLNSMRLPGIESFDPLPRPQTPPRRQPSPMMIDTPSRAPADPYHDRPSSQHYDMNRNLNHLTIHQNTPDAAGSWASEANRAVQAQAEQARAQPPPQTVRFEESPYSARSLQNHHQSAPPVTPKENKRQGWYHGPLARTPTHQQQQPPIDPHLQRTSPEDSSSSEGVPGTPSSASVGEYHPSIMHSNGYVESRNGIAPVPAHAVLGSNAPAPKYAQDGHSEGFTYTQQAPQTPRQNGGLPGPETNMSPLDTLVAVATGQDNVAATAY